MGHPQFILCPLPLFLRPPLFIIEFPEELELELSFPFCIDFIIIALFILELSELLLLELLLELLLKLLLLELLLFEEPLFENPGIYILLKYNKFFNNIKYIKILFLNYFIIK
jgi:hypothetical protein